MYDANTSLDESEKWWEVLKIKRLFLSNNKLQSLGDGFEKLGDGLELLDLTDNQLGEIMSEKQLLSFPFLKELRVNKNKYLSPLFLSDNN